MSMAGMFCQCLILIRVLARPFVDYALGQDSLLVDGGSTSRYSYRFQSERWAATNC